MTHNAPAAKHNHPMIFGRLENDCPRCAELKAGAPTRKGWGRLKYGYSDAEHSADIRAHFASHKHLSGGCGPVCTFGEA